MTNPTQRSLEFDIFMIKNERGNLLPMGSCTRHLEQWLDTLSAGLGKKNSYRAIPYIQRGVDVIYSVLETMMFVHHKKLSSSYGYSATDVTEHPLWQILVSLVTRKYPDIIKVVRPSRTPNESVRAKFINRTFFQFLLHKQRLLQNLQNGIKQSGELGRIQAQLLDAQVESLNQAYQKHGRADDALWQVLNDYYKKQRLLQMTRQRGKKTEVKGKCDAENGALSIDESAELFAEAKVEITKSWDFGCIRNELTGAAAAGAKTLVSANMHANFGTGGGATYLKGGAGKQEPNIVEMPGVNIGKKYTDFTEDELENRNGFVPIQLIPGIDLGVNAVLAAEAGLRLTVTHQLTVGQIMAMTNEAELFVGAEVKAEYKAALNTSNIMGADEVLAFTLAGGAFVGAKAKGSTSMTFKARGINAVSGKVSGEVSAGVGVNGIIESIVRGSGDVKLRMAASASAGVGTGVDFDTTVNPMLLKVILWDGMFHHLTTKNYQRRRDAKLDLKVNSVVVTRCNEKLQMYMVQLDADHKTLAEELWRLPIDASLSLKGGTLTLHDEVSKPHQQAMDQYMSSLGVDGVHDLDDEDEMTNAEAGIKNRARAQHDEAKQAKKAMSKRKKAKKALKGLLVLPPHPEAA